MPHSAEQTTNDAKCEMPIHIRDCTTCGHQYVWLCPEKGHLLCVMISVLQEAMGQAEEETEDEYTKAVSGGNLQRGTT